MTLLNDDDYAVDAREMERGSLHSTAQLTWVAGEPQAIQSSKQPAGKNGDSRENYPCLTARCLCLKREFLNLSPSPNPSPNPNKKHNEPCDRTSMGSS